MAIFGFKSEQSIQDGAKESGLTTFAALRTQLAWVCRTLQGHQGQLLRLIEMHGMHKKMHLVAA